MPDQNIRCFIAIPVEEAVRNELASIQSKLKEVDSGVRWEDPEKFHITVKFLGDITPNEVSTLCSNLRSGLSNYSSFPLLYDSVGAFPNIFRPRIIWIGARANVQLSSIQRPVEEICDKHSLGKEERKRFHPHITIGRIKEGQKLSRLTEILKSITFKPIQSLCQEVLVMKSVLHPSGSRYSLLDSIPLRK